jgi:hypothetical protein
MHYRTAALALACAAFFAGILPAGAVSLADMKDFPQVFGRYGPKGDCSKYPQVLIDARGFALDHGQGKVERAPTVEHAASFFGPDYEGDALAFFPYWTDNGPNPFLVLVDDAHAGSLRIDPHDYGWDGGPPMPARFKPWLAGSPYAKCGG